VKGNGAAGGVSRDDVHDEAAARSEVSTGPGSVREVNSSGVALAQSNLTAVYRKAIPSFKYAEIWVDSSGMPVQTKIVWIKRRCYYNALGAEPNETIKISSEEFNVKLDSNVKIVKG